MKKYDLEKFQKECLKTFLGMRQIDSTLRPLERDYERLKNMLATMILEDSKREDVLGRVQ